MLTVATFNLCNLGADAPPTRLARLGVMIADALEAPDVLALQEVMAESPLAVTGPVPADLAYQALIRAIEQAGGPSYAFREVPPLAHQDGGMVGANIRVGLLFNPLRVSVSDRGYAAPTARVGIRFCDRQPGLTLNPGRIEPEHPAFAGDPRQHWLPSRKALAVECVVGNQRLFVIVCHFKSMRALTHRDEGYARCQRHAQAGVIHDFAADLLACDPQAAIVVLGDFNDVPDSKTLKLLKGEQLYNLLDEVPPAQCYTRRHGEQPQALDHILVSSALRPGARVRIAHLNSDALASRREPTSDHDPVVAQLPLSAA